MKQICLLISLLGFLYGIPAQAQDETTITHRIKKNYRLKTISGITRKLTNDISDDSLKNVLIYYWITAHIKYDVKRLHKVRFRSPKAQRVKRSRKAFCAGYASLYQEMLTHAGIESVKVNGFVKDDEYLKGDLFYRPIHTWNAVNINGGWYLADLCWASGYEIKHNRPFRKLLFNIAGVPYIKNKWKFVRKRNNKYFMSAPLVFVKDHLPVDPMWQLLEEPVLIQQFEYPDSIVADSLKYHLSCCDSINSFLSDPQTRQHLKTVHSSVPANKKNHETSAEELENYLPKNFGDIAENNSLSKSDKLDSLKKTNDYHGEALYHYNEAKKWLQTEMTQLRKKNKEQQQLLTLSNKKQIRSERAVIKKDIAQLKKNKQTLKRDQTQIKTVRTNLSKTIRKGIRIPKKAEKVSRAVADEARAGLEKTARNTERIIFLLNQCDSLFLNTDTTNIRQIINGHLITDSLYNKCITYADKHKHMGIEYERSWRDSVNHSRDTLAVILNLKYNNDKQTFEKENSSVLESVKQLKAHYNEINKLVRENKKLMANATKFLDEYTMKKEDWDQLNEYLKQAADYYFSVMDNKECLLREDNRFLKREISHAKIFTIELYQENKIETLRYKEEQKFLKHTETKTMTKYNSGIKKVKASKVKYKETIRSLETAVKNEKKRGVRT